MGKIIDIRNYLKESNPEVIRQRAIARALLTQAAHILEDLGGRDERIAWVLEDCSELLANRKKINLLKKWDLEQ
ncbi:MAG: hypothetical protein D6719_02555 [Candidatus Dadabacteria bacterium]|nr:MAG: hypothetical protein D6719_02555 [Candidatus Dadabacteria bacterium]